MANNGVNPCFKVFLIAVNFLFLLIGLGILGIGIFLSTNATFVQYQEVLDSIEMLRSMRYVMIGLGVFIVMVGFCGFIGTCKESPCLIKTYIVFLFLILIACIAAIVLAVVFNQQAKNYLTEQLKDRLKRFYGRSDSSEPGVATFTKGIDAIQRGEKCCGWTGKNTENFYKNTPWYQDQPANNKTNYPESCCVETVLGGAKKIKCTMVSTKEKETEAREDGFIHESDCSDKLTDISSRYTQAVLGTVIVAILLQIICISCSIVIARQVSSGEHGGRMV